MLKPISCGLALLLIFSMESGAQSRQAAAAYGERIAASDAAWREAWPDPALNVFPDLAPTTPVLVSDTDARESVAQWEEQVRELEARAGPYAYGLDEPLADLARQRVEEGRFAEAVALYRRSLHILRVNAGLGSPAQLTIVRAMLQLQRALGDREALDDLYGYYYRLGWLRADEPNDNQRWQVALEYLRWQRELLRSSRSRDRERELLELHRLNEQLLEQAGIEEAPAEIQYELAKSQLMNLYLVQDRVTPQAPDTFSVLAPRRNRRSEMFPEDVYRDRLLALQRSAVSEGTDLLASLAGRLQSPVDRAALYRTIGDWEQWNGSWNRAEEAWRRSLDLLRAAGEEARIVEWFGAPVELPDNGVFWQPEADGETSLVRVSFDVSDRGRARGAEATVLSGRESATITVARELRGMRFRPRFDSGQAIPAEGVVRNYRVYH